MITKIANASKENKPVTEEIIKNQKEKPAVTANALNLDEEVLISNRINESH